MRHDGEGEAPRKTRGFPFAGGGIAPDEGRTGAIPPRTVREGDLPRSEKWGYILRRAGTGRVRGE